MRTIVLTGRVAAGRVALIDDQDHDLVAQYRWHATDRARPGGPLLTYAVSRPPGPDTLIYMHRLICDYQRVEHRDQNGLNNQRSNLRECTQSQNLANARRRSDNKSGFKGVCWSSHHDAWRAYITQAGKQHHLGYFAIGEDAAHVRDAAAIRIFGEYACLNFPLEAVLRLWRRGRTSGPGWRTRRCTTWPGRRPATGRSS